MFASTGVKATVSDIMSALSLKNITYKLADNITTDDYDKAAIISGKTINDDLYDDVYYTIELSDAGDLYKKVASAS